MRLDTGMGAIASGISGKKLSGAIYVEKVFVPPIIPVSDLFQMNSDEEDALYNLGESCSYAPYIDIFGRNERNGWSVWGENR